MGDSQAEPVRILLADDDPSLVETLADSVRAEGWLCVTAAGVRDALDLADAHRPAVAVVAYGLPDGNGNDLICELRRRQPGLVCLLMTGHPDLENAVGAVNARAFAYLVKPFQPVQLTALIHPALETRRLREDYQDEIVRAARMHATLEAAGLMQDRINNPLQGIMGNAELIEMMAPDLPARARHLLQGVIRGCEQVGDIVHRLAQALTDEAVREQAGERADVGAMLRALEGAGDETAGGTPSPGQVEEGPLPPDDRRRAPRYSCSSLMLSVPIGQGTRWTFIDNISSGGAGIRLTAPGSLPPRFQARLWDLESRESVPLEVEVCWSKEDRLAPIGLRFVTDEPHVREWLDGVLARIQQRSEASAQGS